METKSRITVQAFAFLLMLQALIFSSCQGINDNAVIRGWRLNNKVFSNIGANQYQNVTGDLVISNNQTYLIENQDFNIVGKITVKDTSSLIIRDSNFTTGVPSDGICIELTDRANLIITNTTVIFKRLPASAFEGEIVVQNNAKANITHSKLQNRAYVIAHNSSFIYVNNSTITTSTTMTDYLHPSGVVTFDSSSAEVKNSTMDGLFVWNNSTASANDSVIGILRFGALEESDKTTVNVTNSKIAYIESFGGAPTLYVEDSTVGNVLLNVRAVAKFTSTSVDQVSAYGNAFALLIDSSAGSIKTQDNATVLVGWQLPLFGIVTLPYGLIPILQWSLVIAVVAIVVIALLVLRRRRANRVQKEESQTKPVKWIIDTWARLRSRDPAR